MCFSISSSYLEQFLLTNLACLEMRKYFHLKLREDRQRKCYKHKLILWALKALFGIFSFLVRSCVWYRNNVKLHAKGPGWTILAVVKQDFVHVTAWNFKTCVTTAKPWNKSFLKAATCLLQSNCNTVLNIKNRFCSHLPPFLIPVSYPQHTLGFFGGWSSKCFCIFFHSKVSVMGFLFPFLLKKLKEPKLVLTSCSSSNSCKPCGAKWVWNI